MEQIITGILKQLMACAGVTNTEQEKNAETWMLDFSGSSRISKDILTCAGYFQYQVILLDAVLYGRWLQRKKKHLMLLPSSSWGIMMW